MTRARVYPSRAQAERVRAAVDLSEGYPRPGVVVGSRVLREVPDEYSAGAFGWTVHAVPIRKHPRRDEYAIVETPATQRAEGRDIDVGDAGPPVRLEADQVEELDDSWTPEPTDLP